MATPVLPYPDMDFTPLDILTAAEMDQMVANDQYLRDFCAGLADGTNLSDGVIQARKIDHGSSNFYVSRYAQDQTISASSETVVQFPVNDFTETEGISYSNGRFTVQTAGIWIITAETGGSSGTSHTTEIKVNGVEISSNRGYNTGANYVSTSVVAKLNAGDYFEILVFAGGTTIINSRAKGNIQAALVS